MIEDGQNGYLVQCRDYKDLAEKILALKEDEKTIRQLGTRGKETVVKKFSLDGMIAGFEHIIKG